MKRYYRFYMSTEEILEFDAEKVSFETAKRRAKAWAKNANASCEYKGIFEHDFQNRALANK